MLNENLINEYSTDEKIVGRWIDGKPVYRKVVNFGELPNQTTKVMEHKISNLRFITKQIGVAKSTKDEYIQFAPDYPVGDLYMHCSQTTINVVAAGDRSRWTEAYIILEYTKTTD